MILSHACLPTPPRLRVIYISTFSLVVVRNERHQSPQGKENSETYCGAISWTKASTSSYTWYNFSEVSFEYFWHIILYSLSKNLMHFSWILSATRPQGMHTATKTTSPNIIKLNMICPENLIPDERKYAKVFWHIDMMVKVKFSQTFKESESLPESIAEMEAVM